MYAEPIQPMSRQDKEAGFSLVEVAIALVLTALVVLTMFQFISDSYTANNSADVQATAANDVQTALNKIEDDINLSSGFDTTISAPFADPFGPDDAGASWTHFGSSATTRALIIKGYATTTNIKNINKVPVYVNSYGCTTDIINSNPLLADRIIYFIRNGNLYRRTLTDTTKTLCNTQYQKQTCPSGMTHATCLGKDVLVIENVTNFSISYYTTASGTTAMSAYTTSPVPDLTTAKTAEFTIAVTRTASGKPYTYQSSIRATKLN
jgi:Tfp pilus assembly protein PilW